MTDDEIYLACLLAIGPWDWEVQQTEFLMDQIFDSFDLPR